MALEKNEILQASRVKGVTTGMCEPAATTGLISEQAATEFRPVSYDCRFFLGDRPCIWHKREGHICECIHYVPVQSNILVIKLDAIGDVLRTTCLLPVIDRAWPRQRLFWITRAEAAPLMHNNPYVTEVLVYGPDALAQLAARRFDRVINLDASPVSAALASAARAGERIGYILHEKGHVHPTNEAAEEWLRLGVFDDLKKRNRRTYQEIMCSILGLPTDRMAYVLELTQEERGAARRHLEGLGVDPGKRLIGIHTGGGGRWRWKQWHAERFMAVAEELKRTLGGETQIILFGGPPERGINLEIGRRLAGNVFDSGCDNSVRHFAALMSLCAVALSGDSLALHVALAVGCRVVALFGPTSDAEIELFGRGEKIIPDLGCLVCYKQECTFSPNCMDLISVETVREAVLRQFHIAGESVPQEVDGVGVDESFAADGR